eukprot:s151_g34.t1
MNTALCVDYVSMIKPHQSQMLNIAEAFGITIILCDHHLSDRSSIIKNHHMEFPVIQPPIINQDQDFGTAQIKKLITLPEWANDKTRKQSTHGPLLCTTEPCTSVGKNCLGS